MNYLELVHHFFTEFFNEKYMIVSIPFLFLVSSASCGGASYFYLKKIREYKKQNEILLIMNHQNNQVIQSMRQSQVIMEQPRPSAPPISYLYSYV
jgi:hypothetical protein